MFRKSKVEHASHVHHKSSSENSESGSLFAHSPHLSSRAEIPKKKLAASLRAHSTSQHRSCVFAASLSAVAFAVQS